MAKKSKVEEESESYGDLYKHHRKYFKTSKGKNALKKARKAYDARDVSRRRRQKRDYMRRKRAENPHIWKK